ncbi:MAG TPA: UbiA family prenyltransferase [Methylophilaceae bacterium]|nr:UbiA family prenyltransferase [Methylophilaceae bacterium]
MKESVVSDPEHLSDDVYRDIETQAASESPSSSPSIDIQTPLCVDLDGTLIKTDLLLESFLVLIKRNPLYIFQCLLWLLHGKAYMKAEIAKRIKLDITLIPYNELITSYLYEEHQRGRKLYLCTASDRLLANEVAKHLGYFSGVFASDGRYNVSGTNKAHVLKHQFGDDGFDYIGNSYDDVPVWKAARKAIVVGNQGIAGAAFKVNTNTTVFEHQGFSLKKALKAMRVYQWVKNILIFIPLLTSHRFTEASAVMYSVIAFFSFSLCASSVYLLNDMLDLEADRRHARKRHRPFAAGHLSLSIGMVMTVALLLSSLGLALLLPPKFTLVLGAYYVLTLAYSFKLKKMQLVDVFALAGLYTSRVVAGGAAAAITLSSWLVLFSITIFLSLAIVKRYTELDAMLRNGGTSAAGRGYLTQDLGILRSFGVAAGYLAVVIMAIYTNSPDIKLLYRHQSGLWGVFALMLFWISWMWMHAFHGKMHDDPIVFALKNRTSLLTIAAIVGCVLIAI